MAPKVILAGGTGFIGSALARRFRERGHEVVVLTRSTPRRRGDGVREVQWDPTRNAATGPEAEASSMGDRAGASEAWRTELGGARAVINLAGASIACVHTPANRERILGSRLDAVHALAAAMRSGAQPPPRVWVQASAVGIYGAGGERRDEAAPAGAGFLADVCRRWEETFRAARPADVRDVTLRVGVVLGRRGGAYPPLARATRWFLGGAAGSGRQGLSWILLHDLEEIFLRVVADDAMRGVYNACAPEPVTNAEFMRELRASLGRPWSPPAPAFAIKLIAPLVLRTEPSLVLEGQFAVPARLQAAGFRFQAPRLGPALTALAD